MSPLHHKGKSCSKPLESGSPESEPTKRTPFVCHVVISRRLH